MSTQVEVCEFDPLNDTNVPVARKASWLKNEAVSIASFLLFSATFYVGITAIVQRSPISPFAGSDSVHSQYGDTIVSIAIFLLSSLASGFIVDYCRLPPLLGMLLIGIAFRNVGRILEFLYVDSAVGIFIRKFAFMVILLRGGLALDAVTLKKMKSACLRLAFIPSTAEATVVAVVAKLLLGFDLVYGFVLGFILAAISPAVVVNGMLEVKDKGLGIEAGIPTLVTAAATMDDLYAITGFSLVQSVAMHAGDQSAFGIVMQVVRAPLEVLLGVVVGAFGVILLLSLGMAIMFGSSAIGASTAGPIAVLTSAFVVPFKWRRDLKKKQSKTCEEDALAHLWNYLIQPVLFSLIGYQLDFSVMGSKLLLSGMLVLLCGFAARFLAAFTASMGIGLDKKERLFVAFSWLPKATVQAALAPVVLDQVNANPALESLRPVGMAILTIGVLSILLSAPAGAILMRFTADKLLKKSADCLNK